MFSLDLITEKRTINLENVDDGIPDKQPLGGSGELETVYEN